MEDLRTLHLNTLTIETAEIQLICFLAASEGLFLTAGTSYQCLEIEGEEEDTVVDVEDLSDDDGRPFKINVLTKIYLGKRETA